MLAAPQALRSADKERLLTPPEGRPSLDGVAAGKLSAMARGNGGLKMMGKPSCRGRQLDKSVGSYRKDLEGQAVEAAPERSSNTLMLWSSPQSSFGHSRIQASATELRNVLSWLLEGQDGPNSAIASAQGPRGKSFQVPHKF